MRPIDAVHTAPTGVCSGTSLAWMLEASAVSSLREIARGDGADQSYVAKHLNLTLLALDIVAAMLEDALPERGRLSALLINPPVSWEDQWAALGTTPAPPRVKKGSRVLAGERLDDRA